jgi:hypothetical protein
MAQPMLDAFDGLPGIAFEPMPVEGFSHQPELDDEVAGQVLRLGLPPFLAPQADEGGFIGAHDDAGVRAADESPTVPFIVHVLAKRHCNLLSAVGLPLLAGSLHGPISWNPYDPIWIIHDDPKGIKRIS